jgi:trehalose 6-phosphate phosphatase
VVDALARLRAEPERAAILLDVDGVLAPIVERPEDARVPEETRAVLRSLVQRYALVGVVTGRPSGDAARLVDVPGVAVAGTHGLELEEIDGVWHERMLEVAAGVPFRFEDKGLSVSFHYRDAADEEAARAELEGVAARAQALGLEARFGRKVLELLPPVDANKGTAVRRLLELAGLSRALYAGDDTTDLDGFAALDDLEVGLRIAVDSAEGPPELAARADVVVDSPAALVELLRTL